MGENRVEFRYTARDVTSTQRGRLLHSKQFIVLLVLLGIGFIFLALHALLPGVFHLIPGVTWTLIVQALVLYIVAFLSLLFIVPWLSFHFTRFWRLPLVFQFNNKSIRLSVSGKSGGLRLNWDQIRQVEEFPYAFVFYYENASKHFILPKSAFLNPRSALRFRELIAKVGQPVPTTNDSGYEDLDEEM